MNEPVQIGQTRKNAVSENPGKLGLVLSADRRNPADAAVASPDLRWQTMTPQEQWKMIWTENRAPECETESAAPALTKEPETIVQQAREVVNS